MIETTGVHHCLLSPLMEPAEYEGWVTPAELCAAASFGSARRRAEYLTWRALVRQQLGRALQFAYNPLGAPYIINHPEYHLSVSHTQGRVAVLVSHHRCAIDIEPTTRSFEAVACKYLTAEEQALSEHPYFLAIAWCAKEALYKYAGEQGLDFKRDLRLLGFDPEASREQLTAQLKDGEPLRLTVSVENGYVVVVLIDCR